MLLSRDSRYCARSAAAAVTMKPINLNPSQRRAPDVKLRVTSYGQQKTLRERFLSNPIPPPLIPLVPYLVCQGIIYKLTDSDTINIGFGVFSALVALSGLLFTIFYQPTPIPPVTVVRKVFGIWDSVLGKFERSDLIKVCDGQAGTAGLPETLARMYGTKAEKIKFLSVQGQVINIKTQSSVKKFTSSLGMIVIEG